MLAITFVQSYFQWKGKVNTIQQTLSKENVRADKVRSVTIYYNTSLPLHFTNIHQGFHSLIFTRSPVAEAPAQPKRSGLLQMAKTLKFVELIQPLLLPHFKAMISTVFKVTIC